MTFSDYFPIWGKLNQDQQEMLLGSLMLRTVPKGTILHNGDMDCTGLLLVKAGQLRAYILSADGDFETYFGRKAKKKRKLYNGMIPCNVYMYFPGR